MNTPDLNTRDLNTRDLNNRKLLSTRTCRNELATLWVFCSLSVLLLLIVQSILGKYGGNTKDVFAWYVPTIMPTLTLIIGVLAHEASTGTGEARLADPFMFRMAFGLSVFYLLMVALVPLSAPFSALPPLELMRMSGLWLGFIQGLVAAALGVFFVKTEHS